MLDNPALKLVLVGKPLVLDPLLALRALLPPGLRALITTNVEELAVEDLAELINKAFEHLDGIVVTGAPNILLDAPPAARLEGTASAREFWISTESSKAVAWHLELWNDCDGTLASILDDLLDLVDGVEEWTIWGVVWCVPVPHLRAEVPLGANLGKLRVLLEFDSPSLILGEVDVNGVDLEAGEAVDALEDSVEFDEVTAWVKHGTTPLETWEVGDADAWSGPLLGLDRLRVDLDREELKERLETVEETSTLLGKDRDKI